MIKFLLMIKAKLLGIKPYTVVHSMKFKPLKFQSTKGNEFYYQNTECPYFPCHPEVREQNCKFCYCPLYHYKCLGTYDILPNGIKDCSMCQLPHTEQGAREIVRLMCNQFDSFREKGFPELLDLSNPCKGCPDDNWCGHTNCAAYAQRFK